MDDSDIQTIPPWRPPNRPAPAQPLVRLSFEALADLFASQRTSLIDDDMVTVDTHQLLSNRRSNDGHD